MKLLRIFLFILSAAAVLNLISKTKIKTKKVVTEEIDIAPKNIFFDIGGVLFDTSKTAVMSKLGIIECMCNSDIENRSFEFMCFMDPEKSDECATFKGRPLPSILCKWQKGKMTCHELCQKVQDCIAQNPNFFKNKTEKKLIKQISELVLPENYLEITKPLYEGFKLAKECKKLGHHIFILSNYDPEHFELLKEEYPKLFEIFDDKDIVLSGNIGIMKPNKKIFKYVINKYKLDPKDCIFIDDQEENLEAASQAGWDEGILYKKASTTRNKLRKRNIL